MRLSFPSSSAHLWHGFALTLASLVSAASAWGQTAAPQKPVEPSIQPKLMQQIAAFAADKATRTPAQTRLSSNLLYELKMRRKEKLPGGLKTLQTGIETNADGLTLLDAKAIVRAELTDFIQRNGGRIVSSSAQWHRIRFWYPLLKLEKLAERAEIRWIRPAEKGQTNVGSVTSEGDITHRADFARAFYNINGAGVRVGVLSDSVDFLANAVATGNLGAVTVLPGQAGSGTGEGTAMLEIIRDLAPNAQLYFATGTSGAANFASNIRALRDAGCQIIVDDISYFSESPFQDDIVAQAVRDVASSGVLYFASAGNAGNLTNNTSSVWEGDFVDSGNQLLFGGNLVGRMHTFGSSVFNTVQTGGSSRRLDLFWSDALDNSGNDYDLYLVNSANNVIALSTDVQNGNDDPYEVIASTVSPSDKVVIVAKTGAQARYLHLNVGRGRLQFATTGRIKGHNGTTGMLSVAAVDVRTTSSSTPFVPQPFVGGPGNPVEPFSSEGPRRMFYSMNGTQLTPGNLLSGGGVVLNKPDIAAADGVVTSFPLNGGLNPFYGTSAAAPHAAAIAALLKSYRPTATAAQISAGMMGSARDIMFFGWDTTSGVGIVTAFDGIGGLQGEGSYLFNYGTLTGSFPINNGSGRHRYAISIERDMDNFEVRATGANTLAVNVRLLDQDGTTQLAFTYGGYGSPTYASVPHLGPGVYYVEVDQAGGYGTYTLTNTILAASPLPNDLELNDAYTLANVLPFSGEKRGHLGFSRTAYDVVDPGDWYTVTVTGEGDFTVNAEALSPNLALNVGIYDQDGTTQLAFTYGNYGSTTSATVPHLGPGTYYVFLQHAGGYGHYRVTNALAPEPIPNDAENNDDVVNALVLPYKGSKQGRLGYSRLPYSVQDDNDWYKVTVTQEGDFTVTAKAESADLAVNLHIYDGDTSTLLATTYGNYGQTINATIPHIGLGTYYIQVQRAGGYRGYTLSNSMAVPTHPNDPEINDIPTQAVTMPLNDLKQGRLGYSRNPYSVQDDLDWYKVTVTGDGNWDVSAQAVSADLAINLHVYDQDKTTLLGTAYGNYGGIVQVVLPHIGAGTYYVQVERAGGYGNYNVANGLNPQNAPNDAELNDSAASAVVLPNLAVPIQGRLGYSRNPYSVQDDADHYRVTLTGDLVLNVEPTPDLAVNVHLLDSTGGSTIANVYGSIGALTTLSVQDLTAGEYVILIERADGYGAYFASIPAATVSGTLTLQGIAVSAPAQPIEFVFRPSDNSGDIVRTANITPNGAFSFIGIPNKQYTLHVKGERYLAKNVLINASSGNVSGVSALLRAGDSNNDNSVDITDLLAMIAHYNAVSPDANYAANVDFNLDGEDDITDLLLLIGNYNQRGDN